MTAELADQVARLVRGIRTMDLKKEPSIAESLDWARTLLLLGVRHIDTETAKATLNVLLKHQSDLAKVAKELTVEES